MKPTLAALLLVCAPAAFAGEECHHPAEPHAQLDKGGAKGSKAAAEKKDAKVEAPAAKAEGWVLTRGEKIGASPQVGLAELLAGPASYDGKPVVLEGTVRKACARKGCWMELAGDAKAPGVRVTFKDYGFFVPLDAEGSKARVEGVVKVALLSDDHARHYEGEGAIVPRGADGKPREVQLVASGVELRR